MRCAGPGPRATPTMGTTTGAMSSPHARRGSSYNVAGGGDVSSSLTYDRTMKSIQTFLCSFVFAVLSTSQAQAQPVVAGLKIGIPFTDAFQAGYPSITALTASSNSYTLGPFVEVRLPLNLSIEADALYRGLKFSNITGSATTAEWDFPVVAKYKLLKGPIRPYIEGGLDFSHLSDLKNFVV